ncbi:MAG: beta-propeller fold lactonase family protein [Betaproteobacteria bacterium]|jgi:YVTN family beta-propeller protein|nr:MAG: beta-propeller fold lactonase family protein [Betaproteobacteria bacterium]
MKSPTMTRILVLTALIGIAGLSACSKEEPAQEAALAGFAYISNQKGNVTVIDLATFEPVSEINVGAEGPRGIGITPDGKLLVTANVEGGDISLIDRVSGEVLKRVPIGENPEFVRIRGNRAFVSFEPAAIGGPPPKPGSEEAKRLAEQREEDEEEPAKVAVVDLDEGKVIKAITGGMETEGIEFSADGSKIIVTNEADENVTVHDIESGEMVKDISTREYGNRPRGIKMSPDGNMYVASIEYGNSLVVMDGDFNVVRKVDTGQVPYGLTFNRDGSRLLVALAKGQVIQVFDTSTWEPVGQVETGKRCWHFSYTPDDSHILIACGRSDEVVVIDVKEMKVIKRIGEQKMPWGVVVYPRSVGTLDAPWQ